MQSAFRGHFEVCRNNRAQKWSNVAFLSLISAGRERLQGNATCFLQTLTRYLQPGFAYVLTVPTFFFFHRLRCLSGVAGLFVFSHFSSHDYNSCPGTFRQFPQTSTNSHLRGKTAPKDHKVKHFWQITRG